MEVAVRHPDHPLRLMSANAAAAVPAPLAVSRRNLVMISLLVSSVMASLDSSFVPLSFRDMITKLDTSTSVVVWVALGYLIAATGPMLLTARIAERIGLVQTFRLGTLVYCASMAACTWAPDIGALIALRVVQGFGMALFLPTTFTIAAQIHAPSERGKALGVLQVGNALGFVLGPIFAGWLLDAYDWRAIFWSRIPFGVIAILLAWMVFPRELAAQRATTARRDWDFRGAIFLTVAIFGILFGCNRLPVEDNHLDPLVWLVLAVGLVVGWLFMRHESRVADPLIDLSLFRSSTGFRKAALAFTAYFASTPVYLFVLPLVMFNALEMPAWDAGLTLALVALVTTVVSPLAGRAADRFGSEALCTAGAVLVALGYLALLPIEPQHSALQLMPAMILLGFGSGLFFSPNNTLLMSNVPPARLGMASGLIGILRQSGYALGFALIASLFTAIQDGVEEKWTAVGLRQLGGQSAESLAYLFEEGGIWSPDVLLFILKVAVFIGAGIVLVSAINSWPRWKPSGRAQLASVGAAVAAIFAAVAIYVPMSGLQFQPAEVAADAGAKLPPIAPFGLARRAEVEFRSAVAGVSDPVAAGAAVYAANCVACHGADRKGLPNLGVNLLVSKFVQGQSQEQLVAFLKIGRMPGQPGNVTGGVMPAFTYLPEAELSAVAAYLKSAP
jgi:EmrB/QacA subfamily drug resistance transporter